MNQSVKVFRLVGFDRRGGSVHGRALYRPVMPIKRTEANLLVYHGCAVWHPRSKRQITLLVPVNAFYLFIGQMRYRGTPEARGIDSKTHKRERLQYRHIRTGEYSTNARQLSEDAMDSELTYCYLCERGASERTIRRLIPELFPDTV